VPSILKSLILLVLLSACASAAPKSPCSLLSREEIATIQGEMVVDAQETVQSHDGVRVAQCFYRTQTLANSVTLEVTTARNIHELWEKQFEPDEKHDRDSELHSIEIKALGRDAVWTGNRVSGALYVLTRDAIMRISIGGPGVVQSKIEKSKELAKRVFAKSK